MVVLRGNGSSMGKVWEKGVLWGRLGGKGVLGGKWGISGGEWRFCGGNWGGSVKESGVE